MAFLLALGVRKQQRGTNFMKGYEIVSNVMFQDKKKQATLWLAFFIKSAKADYIYNIWESNGQKSKQSGELFAWPGVIAQTYKKRCG